jgi:hypothetical protein
MTGKCQHRSSQATPPVRNRLVAHTGAGPIGGSAVGYIGGDGKDGGYRECAAPQREECDHWALVELATSPLMMDERKAERCQM